jgi:hypothetical protein
MLETLGMIALILFDVVVVGIMGYWVFTCGKKEK